MKLKDFTLTSESFEAEVSMDKNNKVERIYKAG